MDTNYWRSFEEMQRDPEVLEARAHEFAEGVTDEFNPDELSGVSRRQFLALMGASAAVAGTGCDWRDQGEIVAYNKKPEDGIPGRPAYFASTIFDGGAAHSVLVKTREGRPIKIDGNPDHPVARGKAGVRVQACTMDLYDPGRLRAPQQRGGKAIAWDQVDATVSAALKAVGSKEVALVTGKVLSPTQLAAFAAFQKAHPTTKIYSYEAFNRQVKDAAFSACYASSVFPTVDWAQAKIVVALEADLLGSEGSDLSAMREIAKNRDMLKTSLDDFVRIYAVEGQMSATGASADYRLRLRPDQQLSFVLGLLHALKGKTKNTIPAGLPLKAYASSDDVLKARFAQMVKDLLANQGRAMVLAGDKLPHGVQVAVNALNEALGNNVLYQADKTADSLLALSSSKDWDALVAGMNAGNVGVLIHLDSNPVYHLPADIAYPAALKKVPLVVSLVQAENETSALGHLSLPAAHDLESWGDAQAEAGLYNLQQPIIAPLHDARQKEAVLLTWAGSKFNDKLYYKFLNANWQKTVYPKSGAIVDFADFWRSALHDGFVTTSQRGAGLGAFKAGATAGIKAVGASKGFAVLLTESPALYDGRYANNGWLQETPHPVSKVVWDNYAAMSLVTAKALGVKLYAASYDQGYFSPFKKFDLVTVTVDGRTLTLPALLQPGMADDMVAIQLGYGRSVAGAVAKGDNEDRDVVGFDANALRSKADSFALIYSGASVVKAGGQYSVVSTQEHHAIDPENNNLEPSLAKTLSGTTADGKNIGMHGARDIVLESTVAEYKLNAKNTNFVKEKKNIKMDIFSINEPLEYPGHKWGMSINLNTCTGCNACVTSCNAENNIPAVGKTQSARGREMTWMRIDRYYAGTSSDPTVSQQPMLCQHCDNAPCENVCPVVATSHSAEGLNDMTYNRCVGTRYCANNCPYKVRRFNYHNFRNVVGRETWHGKGHYEAEPVSLMHNPEVTVRSRGVMEKCTFCVQRISDAKQLAKEDGRAVRDGDIKTACQVSCPVDAISFGDVNDPHSAVSIAKSKNLGYEVLDTLNVRPNVTYLMKLRNVEASVEKKEANA